MKKLTCVLAILAAASTAALAKDLKQDKKDTTPPTVSATQMNHSEMDKVTAGDAGGDPNSNKGIGSLYGQTNAAAANQIGNKGGNAGGNSAAAIGHGKP